MKDFFQSKNLTFIIFMIFMACPAGAEENKWKGEITPYLWAARMEGDATVSGRTVNVDVGFEDTDPGGSVLTVLQYGQAVCWGQIDYLSLSSDDLDIPERGELELDLTIGTLAVGYQFQGAKGKAYDLLVGVRQLWLDRELTVNDTETFRRDRDVTDMVLVFRPSVPLSQNWRFNPTLSFGGGYSELTYELWPQLQYHLSEHLAVRFGYRRLYYDVETEGGNKWDGTFQGLVIGLGITW